MAMIRRLLFLTLILFTLPAGSCPGDNVGPPTEPEFDFRMDPNPDPDSWVLTGWVQIDDSPAAGVSVSVTSASLATSMTEGTAKDGAYSFEIPGPGTYTVTIPGFRQRCGLKASRKPSKFSNQIPSIGTGRFLTATGRLRWMYWSSSRTHIPSAGS